MKIQGKIQEKGKVTFIQAVKDFYKGYIDFGGRSTRGGYWWATLFTSLISLLYAIGLIFATINYALNNNSDSILGLVIILGGAILSLIFLFPSFPLTCRRMRDAGMTTTAIVVFYIVSTAVSIVSSIHENSTFFTFATSVVGLIQFVITVLPSDQLTTDSQNPWAQKFFRQKEVKPLTGKEANPSTVIQRAMENEDGTKVIPALKEQEMNSSSDHTILRSGEEKEDSSCSHCSSLPEEKKEEKK